MRTTISPSRPPTPLSPGPQGLLDIRHDLAGQAHRLLGGVLRVDARRNAVRKAVGIAGGTLVPIQDRPAPRAFSKLRIAEGGLGAEPLDRVTEHDLLARAVQERLEGLLPHLLGQEACDVVASPSGQVFRPAEVLRRLLEPTPPFLTGSSPLFGTAWSGPSLFGMLGFGAHGPS